MYAGGHYTTGLNTVKMKSTEVLNARCKCGIMLVRLMVDLGCECCLVSTFVMRWRYTKLLFWGVVLVLR